MEITVIKYGLLSEHVLQKTKQHGGHKNPLGSEKFVLKNYIFQFSHQIKKINQSKLYLGKEFFAATTFKGL